MLFSKLVNILEFFEEVVIVLKDVEWIKKEIFGM